MYWMGGMCGCSARWWATLHASTACAVARGDAVLLHVDEVGAPSRGHPRHRNWITMAADTHTLRTAECPPLCSRRDMRMRPLTLAKNSGMWQRNHIPLSRPVRFPLPSISSSDSLPSTAPRAGALQNHNISTVPPHGEPSALAAPCQSPKRAHHSLYSAHADIAHWSRATKSDDHAYLTSTRYHPVRHATCSLRPTQAAVQRRLCPVELPVRLTIPLLRPVAPRQAVLA